MMRVLVFCILLLTPASSFSQQMDSTKAPGFFLSLDAKGEKLLIPAGPDSMKVYGVKIFTADGKELISKKIDNPLQQNEINISGLNDGDYIVHVITIEQVLYKTKFTVNRGENKQ